MQHIASSSTTHPARPNTIRTSEANPGRTWPLLLSRSYHESLKNNKAVVVKESPCRKDSLIAGDVTKDFTLFYSRPKELQAVGRRQMLLDLLAEHHYRQGQRTLPSTEGMDITSGTPTIEGLELGKHLLGAGGRQRTLPGLIDSGVREFNYLGS
jgi:hypothetical protein